MGRGTMAARFCAVLAMIACAGNLTQAVAYFHAHNVGKAPTDVRHFLQLWYKRYLERQPDDDFLKDKHRSGRPSKIDEETAAKCATEFKRGHWSHGKWRPYVNYTDVSRLMCRTNWRRLPPAAHPARHPCPQQRQLPTHLCLTCSCRHVREIRICSAWCSKASLLNI
jgi:hypothetical protein